MEYLEVVKKAWADPNYKKDFLENPKKILNQEGFNIGENENIYVHEITDQERHIILPKKTDEVPEELKKQEKYYALVQKLWSDPKLKKEFLSNPKAVLKRQGFDIPADEKVRVIAHENTDNETHLVLPKKGEGELSEQEIAGISGGILPFLILGGIGLAAAGLLGVSISQSGGKTPTRGTQAS